MLRANADLEGRRCERKKHRTRHTTTATHQTTSTGSQWPHGNHHSKPQAMQHQKNTYITPFSKHCTTTTTPQPPQHTTTTFDKTHMQCVRACMNACLCACMCACKCASACMHVRACACVSACECACVQVCASVRSCARGCLYAWHD
jgi:hypothetical protein